VQSVRIPVAFAAMVLALALGAPASAATAIQGTFVIHFGRGSGASNAPCPSDTFCGVGKLAGFGPAIDTLDFTSFEEIEGTSCFAVTVTETITLLDGSGTLVLDEAGTFCSPGASGEAPLPPSNQNYGHPATMTTEFTVDTTASTGVFAGLSGSGTSSFVAAGDTAVWGPSGE
jgi:hypothetical protein